MMYAIETELDDIDGERPSLLSVVAAELRRRILALELPPGTHLAESKLAEQLGVSRNPVREAIRVLSSEGFVELSPRRGAFVAQLTPEQAEQLMDLRMVVEPFGVRLAAGQGPSRGVEHLRETIEAAHRAFRDGKDDELAELNTEFHIGAAEMSGNPHLVVITAQLIKRAQWVYRQNAALHAPESWAEHEKIASAIESGDAEWAEAAARAHVAAARHRFRVALARREPRP